MSVSSQELQQLVEQFRHVDGFALRAVRNLVAATGAVGDDDRIRPLSHGGQQLGFGHLH